MKARKFKKISILLIIFSLSFDKVCVAALVEDNQSQTKTTPKQSNLKRKEPKSRATRTQRFKQKQKQKRELFFEQAEERKRIASQHRKRSKDLLRQKRLAKQQKKAEKERTLQEQFILKQEQKKRARAERKLRLQQIKLEKKPDVQEVKPTLQQQPPIQQVEEQKVRVAPHHQNQSQQQEDNIKKTLLVQNQQLPLQQAAPQEEKEANVRPKGQGVVSQVSDLEYIDNVRTVNDASTSLPREDSIPTLIDTVNSVLMETNITHPMNERSSSSQDGESSSPNPLFSFKMEKTDVPFIPQTKVLKAQKLAENAPRIEQLLQEALRQQENQPRGNLAQELETARLKKEEEYRLKEEEEKKDLRIAHELLVKKEEETARLKLEQEALEQKRKEEEAVFLKQEKEEQLRKDQELETIRLQQQQEKGELEEQKRKDEEVARLKLEQEAHEKKEKEIGLQQLKVEREKFKQLEETARAQPFSKKANAHINKRQEKENAISHKMRELNLFLDKEEKKIQDAKLGEKTGDAIAQFKTNERSYYASAENYFAWLNGAEAQEAKHLQIGKSDTNHGMQNIFLGWLNSANPQVINLLKNLSAKYLVENKNPAAKESHRKGLEVGIGIFAKDANYRWEKNQLLVEDKKKLLDDKEKMTIENQEFKKRFFDDKGKTKKKDVLKHLKKSSAALSLDYYIFYDDSDPKNSREVYRVVLLGDSNYTATLLLDPIQNKKSLK